jgi:hypothetical protein
MNSRSTLRLAAVFLLFLSSCRGCGQRGPQDVRELASANAAAAAVIGNLGTFVAHTDAFATRATRKAGAALWQRTREGLQKQAGIDLLDPKAYDEWGVDADAGLIFFSEEAGKPPLLGLGIKDQKKFDASMKALAARVDSAETTSEATLHGYRVVTASRPFGTEAVAALSWAHVGRLALLANGDNKAQLDTVLCRLRTAEEAKDKASVTSLATDPTFRSMTSKVAAADLLLFLRGAAAGALLSPAATSLSSGAVTTIALGAEGFASDTFMNVNIPGIDKALAGPAPADLAARVDADAAFLLLSRSLRGDGLHLLRSQPALSPLIDKALAALKNEIGIDFEREIVPLLSGAVTASVHLNDVGKLAAELQQNRAGMNWLDFANVVLTAEVTDAKAMLSLLERSQAELGKRGVKIAKSEQKLGDKSAVLFTPELGGKAKLGWALLGNVYVYAAGTGRLERALATVAGQGQNMRQGLSASPVGKLADQEGATVAILRAGSIADSVSRTAAAPAAAMSLGALISGALELLRTINDVALSVQAEEGGLRIKTREQMQ